jgi:siderophore synthetase component
MKSRPASWEISSFRSRLAIRMADPCGSAAPLLHLWDVRRWALSSGLTRAEFRREYRLAYLTSVSRLLQSIYREALIPSKLFRERGKSSAVLCFGEMAELRLRVCHPLPFKRIAARAVPTAQRRGRQRRVPRAGSFLRALRTCAPRGIVKEQFDRLIDDFNNSFANLVLNRILGRVAQHSTTPIEPSFQGHHYYPFPALRIGPSLADVVECSNLSESAVDLQSISADSTQFISAFFSSWYECCGAWSGDLLAAHPEGLLPLHPWQLQNSLLVRELLATGAVRLTKLRTKAVPLASQRTCRIVSTGYDLKLPIDITLTGEHRLLFPINCFNAPSISFLARALLGESPTHSFGFQYDVAAIRHSDESIAPHLSAIVRAPIKAEPGSTVVPALNLWSGPQSARSIFRLRSKAHAERVFVAYCSLLVEGTISAYLRWGMALEPHLQNVLITVRNDMPVGIIVRDLDGTILDARRIRPLAKRLGLPLARATWDHMPSYEIGGQRLMHALLYGHLGEVMSCVAQNSGMALPRLSRLLDDIWAQIDGSRSERASMRKLWSYGAQVKNVLAMRLTRDPHMRFV